MKNSRPLTIPRRNFLSAMSKHLILACLATAAAARTPSGPSNLYEVDRGGFHYMSSLGLAPSGRPAAAYGDDRLYYAEWDGMRWLRTVVDDQTCLYPGYRADSYVLLDLAFDPAGEPGISYFDATANSLKLARRSGSTWRLEVVDTGVGFQNSLAFDPLGNAHIGYGAATAEVRYAFSDGVSWSLETVDTGAFGSLAVDASGTPHLAYKDVVQNDLRYAHKVAGSWARETVDASGDAGGRAAIALTASGQPRIIYYVSTGSKYASWDGTAWRVEPVPGGTNFDGFYSLVLDRGDHPHAANFKWGMMSPDASLWYVHHDGTAWTSVEVANDELGINPSIALDALDRPQITHSDIRDIAIAWTRWTGTSWISSPVDRDRGVGAQSSVALDGTERPAAAYWDQNGDDLGYASWNGTGWTVEMVDTMNEVGSGPSLALDASGIPHVSYVDTTFLELRYARKQGASWLLGTVDSSRRVAGATSLALDAAGDPHVSYASVLGTLDFDLDYAWWDGSAWTTEEVDAAGSVGRNNSLALDPTGLPRIAYEDTTNRALKYARRDLSSWTIETVAVAGQILGPTPLALDAAGNPHIAVYESAANELRYLHWDGAAWQVEVIAPGQVSKPSLALDPAGFPHVAALGLGEILIHAKRDAFGWQVATLDGAYLPPSIAVGPSGNFTISYAGREGPCGGGTVLQIATGRHLGPLTHFRGKVMSILAPGWKSAALPLGAVNDDETSGFPTPGAGPGTLVDLAVPDVPLVLYRNLAAGDANSGNALKLVKIPGGIELSE